MAVVYAVYIISRDGLPLVWQIFQTPEFIPSEGLLSPLLSSLQGLSVDLVKQEGVAEKITLRGITYHMKSYGNYFVVILMESDDKPTKALNQIGWQFLQEYKDKISNWKGNISDFTQFKETIIKILQSNYSIDSSSSINPTKKFSTSALFNLSKDLKDTAISMVGLKKATAKEVADDVNKNVDTVRAHLIELQKMGYLGVENKDDEQIFFY